MIDYTITFKQDVYSIKNTGTNALTFVLKSINSCTSSSKQTATGSIAVNATYVLPLAEDSVYEMLLTDSVTLATKTFNINYFQNLELSLLEDIFTVLCTCNCGCADCVDVSARPCESLLTAKVRTEMYSLLSGPRYTAYIAIAMKAAICYTSPSLYCSLTSEWVSGNADYNEKLMKQILALSYLGLYFQELASLTLQADVDYLNGKFRTESVFCCITKLGVDINEVKALITSTLGTVTVNTGAYINRPPTTGNAVLTTPNRTPLVLPISVFPYNDVEGTQIQAIRITSLLAGLPIGTLKWNGVDVVVGQVITAVQFAQHNLVFTPPSQNLADTDIFTYAAQDGNGIWSTD